MVDRLRLVAGLAIAFAAVALEPLLADALDQFSLLAVLLLVTAGLGLVWRSAEA